VVQSARVVASSIRIVVRYPATSSRGTLKGLYLPDENAINVASQNYAQLGALNATRWANSSASGEIGIDVAYRPVDSTSFEFNTTASVGTGGGPIPQLLVIGEGWPTGTSIDTFVITHYETLSGVDQAGDDADSGENTLSSNSVSLDMAGNNASRLQPVTTSISSIELLDHALENAARSGARTGMSTRSRFGGVLGRSESSQPFRTENGLGTPGEIHQPETLAALAPRDREVFVLVKQP